MKLNSAVVPILTHEGGNSTPGTALQSLRRSVLNCMLWEDTFYESGVEISKRISELVAQNKPEDVCNLAVEARQKYYLRHVPLFVLSELSKRPGPKPYITEALASVIERVDELSEFLAIYWKDGKHPIAASVKRGLAQAFTKFNEYQLAKYNRDNNIKIRDVMFMCHPRPKDTEQADLWKRLVLNELKTPDTWEVSLSAGKDKKETFERLLAEGKLGGLAVLRNLRNMQQAGVDENLVRSRLSDGIAKVFPYRFITAAKYWPAIEDALEQAMFKATEAMEPIIGSTGLLVDVSGSMHGIINNKSEAERLDAANGLAILLREKCKDLFKVASFTTKAMEIAPRRGFALAEAIKTSQNGGTDIQGSLEQCLNKFNWNKLDRIIVITDEQGYSNNRMPYLPNTKCYCINVAAYKNGISYTKGWTHIDGWSERSIDYIREVESNGN